MRLARLKEKRIAFTLAAVFGAAVVALVVWWALSGPEPEPILGPLVGSASGAAALVAVGEAPSWRVPARCMEPDAEAPSAAGGVRVGERRYVLARGRLEGGDASRQRALVGFVADARGADPETLAHVHAAVADFAAAGVDVVVSLGGHGTTRVELEPVLTALAGTGEWLLVALPGDREAVDAHRETVRALAAAGARIVDGSSLGLVVVDGVVLALVPGAASAVDGSAHGLVARADGCARSGGDLAALLARLAADPGPRVIAAHQPPRQRGLDATDLAVGGVHVGEPALAELAAHVGAVAFVHGGVDEAGGRMVRATWGATSRAISTMAWAEHLSVAVGPLEALPHPHLVRTPGPLGAVVVEIDHMRARVRAVRGAARNPGTLQ